MGRPRDGRRPYRVVFEDDRPLAMAGIWEQRTPPTTQADPDDFGKGSAETVVRETFAVATTAQNDPADLHYGRRSSCRPARNAGGWTPTRRRLTPYPAD